MKRFGLALIGSLICAIQIYCIVRDIQAPWALVFSKIFSVLVWGFISYSMWRYFKQSGLWRMAAPFIVAVIVAVFMGELTGISPAFDDLVMGITIAVVASIVIFIIAADMRAIIICDKLSLRIYLGHLGVFLLLALAAAEALIGFDAKSIDRQTCAVFGGGLLLGWMYAPVLIKAVFPNHANAAESSTVAQSAE